MQAANAIVTGGNAKHGQHQLTAMDKVMGYPEVADGIIAGDSDGKLTEKIGVPLLRASQVITGATK